MSAKRKRVVVSLETKLNAIRRLDKGESIKTVAKDLGVGEVTVGDWRRKRADFDKWGAQILNCNSERKTFKKCEFEKTSEALFIWFSEMRAKGSPISRPILQAKALYFHKILYSGKGDSDEPFTASFGWLTRWKNRYGVRQLDISGEKLSANETGVTVFQHNISSLILSEGLTSDQIFNCDETGLNFRILPTKTLAARQEISAPGFNMSKDRVTVLGCANAAGSLKLKPLVIGKPKKPRAFKNTNVDTFPSTYRNQRNGWMDSHLFKAWFFDDFVPIVEAFLEKKKLPRKAILILDNVPSHPDAEELVSKDIRALLLPPSVTPLIQPLEQGVLETLKRNYKKRLLRTLLEKLEEGLGVTSALELITLKDVVYWVSEAWDNVREDTIRRSWRNIFGIEKATQDEAAAFEKEQESEIEELVVLGNHLPLAEPAEPINADDITDWINEDKQALTDDAIIDILNAPEDDEKSEKLSTEVRPRESDSFAGQLDQSIPVPSTDGESVAEQSYAHSFADTDNQGVDQQGTSEGGYEDEGWDAEVEGSRLERPGGAYEDTLDLFGRYLASILRQLPDTPCYSLQQKFIDEAISARLSFGPSVPSHRSPSHNAPQPPEDGNKKPPPTDSSRRTKSQSMKARAQKNKASNIPSSAEAPVPNALPARRASPQPAPPLLAVTIKEEVVDDEMCDVLDDQSGGIDIEEQELSSIKPEVDTAFELVMCDGLNQGSTGQRESTVSATSTEKASPFRCLICPKTFVRSSGLRNHYRDKHPDCDPNFKSKPLNENEQQSKRPCLERDLQVSKGSLEHCLMVPGRNPVTTPAQKTLLYLGKPSVSPAGPVPPSHKPSLTSVSSPMPGPSFLPGTNLSQVPIDTKPGPSSVQSQPSSSTQSVQNQPLFLDPQYHT